VVPDVGPPGRVNVERLIALEGAVNFRDLGGYATVDGQRTRWRVLFRADGLSELTGADLEVMRSLGIRTVVDLRSAHEVEQSRFDVDAHPVTFHHYPFIRALPDAESFARAPGFLGVQYKEMLDGAAPEIIGALSALAAPEARPAVFHCTAGKDRTGLLSALVLSLLGVPEETVLADYALSGAAMARLRAKLIAKYPDGEGFIADSDQLFSADPANMVALFAHLRHRYGTIEGYASTIGVPAEVIGRLREALLEPAGDQ
jgi:protein-tyrosine phosphatase